MNDNSYDSFKLHMLANIGSRYFYITKHFLLIALLLLINNETYDMLKLCSTN